MTWQELGALGELAGAFAAVALLGYIAYQIRQNTRVVRSATDQAQADAHSRYLSLLAQDPELTRLFRRGASGESLDQDESLRFSFLLHLLFTQIQAAYFHYREGVVSPKQWQNVHRVAARWLSSAGTQAWWARDKRILRDEFVQYIDTEVLRED
jgi:hypothetical protein